MLKKIIAITILFLYLTFPLLAEAGKGADIWGFAFYDTNRNGEYDPGERNLPAYSVVQLWVKRQGRYIWLGNYYPTKPAGWFYISNVKSTGWHMLRIVNLPRGHQPTTATSYFFYLDGRYKKLGPYLFGAAPIPTPTPTPTPSPTPSPTPTPKPASILLNIPKAGTFPIKKISTSSITSTLTLSPFKISAYSPTPQSFTLTLSSTHLFLKQDKRFFIDVRNLTVEPNDLIIKGNKPRIARLGKKHKFTSPSDQALVLEVKDQQGSTELEGKIKLFLNIPPNQVAGEYEGNLVFTLQ